MRPKKTIRLYSFFSVAIMILTLFFTALILSFCANSDTEARQEKKISKQEKNVSRQNLTSAQAQTIIATRSQEVLLALKQKDMKKLASFVHPTKGVRFTPYSYVNLKEDLVFQSSNLKSVLEDTTRHLWGYYDATGKPIKETFLKYYDKFVYDQDFSNAEKIGFQKILGSGNTANNVFEVYPQAIVVEYFFSGFNPKLDGMDWESLRLVFEKEGDNWFLVGIIHDQWTS